MAVSIRIGVQSSRSRSVRQTTKPFVPGQHDVEDDGVVGVDVGHPERFGAVVDDVDGEPVGGQSVLQRASQLHLVLDDQQSHASNLMDDSVPAAADGQSDARRAS